MMDIAQWHSNCLERRCGHSHNAQKLDAGRRMRSEGRIRSSLFSRIYWHAGKRYFYCCLFLLLLCALACLRVEILHIIDCIFPTCVVHIVYIVYIVYIVLLCLVNCILWIANYVCVSCVLLCVLCVLYYCVQTEKKEYEEKFEQEERDKREAERKAQEQSSPDLPQSK